MMLKKYRWLVLVVGLTLLYGLAYFIFKQTATGEAFGGVIPEFIIYLLPVYFMSSLWVELILAEGPAKHLGLALKKALMLLGMLMLYAVIYFLFSHYVVVPFQLKDSLWDTIANLTLLFLFVFCLMKAAQKFDTQTSDEV